MTEVKFGDEHDFTGKLEDWEERVFRAAAERNGQFTTYRRIGHTKKFFETFPLALKDIHEETECLIYAVAPSGRFVNLPRSSWNKYARLWIAIRGKEVETKLIPFRQVFPDADTVKADKVWCAYAHTKNVDGKHAVYGGVFYAAVNNAPQINRVIMSGEFMRYEDAIKHFPELKQEEYRE